MLKVLSMIILSSLLQENISLIVFVYPYLLLKVQMSAPLAADCYILYQIFLVCDNY